MIKVCLNVLGCAAIGVVAGVLLAPCLIPHGANFGRVFATAFPVIVLAGGGIGFFVGWRGRGRGKG